MTTMTRRKLAALLAAELYRRDVLCKGAGHATTEQVDRIEESLAAIEGDEAIPYWPTSDDERRAAGMTT